MKIFSGIICTLVVLAWVGSMMGESETDAATASVASEAVSDSSSEADAIVELTVEGEALSSEVGDLAREGAEAAGVADLGRVCEIVAEASPKVNRLGRIVDELDAYSAVDQATISELRGNEATIRAGFAAADEVC